AVLGHQRELFYALLLVAFEAAQAEDPANGSRLAANNVFAQPGGNVGIVIIRRAGEKALSVTVGRLGVGERAELLLGDQRGIVSAQPVQERQREKSAGIVLVALQASLGQLFRTAESLIESEPVLRIPGHGRTVTETIVRAKQLAAQDAQSVKLAKEHRAGLRHQEHGIVGSGGARGIRPRTAP